MAIKNIFGKKDLGFIQEYDPQILTNKNLIFNQVTPKGAGNDDVEFKGEVQQNTIKCPEELGEAHPYDFKLTENTFKKVGFVNAVVSKYADYIIGPGFWVESEEKKATEIIEQWIRDVNFENVLKSWVKEALVKDGFLELGGKPEETVKGAKVLDSKYMYVKRDNKGVIEKYNQYRGAFNKFAKDKVNEFEPFQIAHISFNKIGDMSYGLGIVYPAINTVDNLLQNESDLHMLMNRKANSPYHVKLGGVVGGKYYKPNPNTVNAFGKDLQWLNNKHEWVTDGLTDIKAIDFGNIGEKFSEVLRYDEEMLLYAFQVPSVLMGTANINEGIAKVQMDAFDRRVKSFQAEIEKVIETKIFKRILNANGFDVHVEFNWGRPSNTERYERLMKIVPLMTSQTTSATLQKMLEKEAVKILELNEQEFDEMMAEEEEERKVAQEEERKKEEERPQPLVPGQNAKSPKENFNINEFIRKKGNQWCVYSHQTGKNFGCYDTKAKAEKRLAQIKAFSEKYEYLDSCPHCNEKVSNYNDIEEWLGFNYNEYVDEIEDVIKKDEFLQIAAATGLEETAGLLSKTQVRVLKEILGKGFRNGSSINDMVNEVNKNLELKDLLKMEDGEIIKKNGTPVVVRSKESRAVGIVRTEVSRTANAGAISHFKQGGINKIRWVTSFGERTCPECEALNGVVYEVDNHPDIPLHPMCRCTVAPVTNLQ